MGPGLKGPMAGTRRGGARFVWGFEQLFAEVEKGQLAENWVNWSKSHAGRVNWSTGRLALERRPEATFTVFRPSLRVNWPT
jgi:hypothetical protein